MNPVEHYLNGMHDRLEKDRFYVRRDVELPGGSYAWLAAARVHFSWNGLHLISQHIFARYSYEPTVEEMQRFYEAGLEYAQQHNQVPLLRGMNFGYMIIPCLIMEHEELVVDPLAPPIPTVESSKRTRLSIMQYVAGPPRPHFAITELPVLYGLYSDKAHYYQGGRLGSTWLHPMARKLVTRYIEYRTDSNSYSP